MSGSAGKPGRFVGAVDVARKAAGCGGEATEVARALRAQGFATVLVLNVPVEGGVLHWLDAEHARGWLRPGAGQGALEDAAVARELASASQRGFVGADAAIVAIVRAAGVDMPHDGSVLPQLSWDEARVFATSRPASSAPPLGLYGIADSAARVRQLLEAGVRTLQLRIKRPEAADAAWDARLRAEIADAIAACRRAAALLFVNDHWAAAADLGADGVHLGQEDLEALGAQGRGRLLASGVALGVSSHSLWELCRARALAPGYIACGPVWPTTTKQMPWRPQGEDNLRWWSRVAGAPVVAIGGVLGPAQVEQAAAWGADGVCLVRGLGEDPAAVVPGLLDALHRGHRSRTPQGPAWPHPSLP